MNAMTTSYLEKQELRKKLTQAKREARKAATAVERMREKAVKARHNLASYEHEMSHFAHVQKMATATTKRLEETLERVAKKGKR